MTELTNLRRGVNCERFHLEEEVPLGQPISRHRNRFVTVEHFSWPNKAQVEQAIAEARELVGTRGLNDDDTVYLKSTWERTAQFLNGMGRHWWTHMRPLPRPYIEEGFAGSFDLRWEFAGNRLVVTIPPETSEPPTFYARSFDGEPVEDIATFEALADAAPWLR